MKKKTKIGGPHKFVVGNLGIQGKRYQRQKKKQKTFRGHKLFKRNVGFAVDH